MNEPSTVELSDGRDLAYAEYGDLEGAPVLAFHGVLGSRRTWSLCDDAAREQGVRLVAPDRPGFGHSDFQPGRVLRDWPSDVRELTDHLEIDRFGVAGFSAGGPHAVACAHEMPDRVDRATLVSTVTPRGTRGKANPFNNAVLSATRMIPGFSQTAFGTAAVLAATSHAHLRSAMVGSAAAPDRALFDGPHGEELVADAAEGFRSGGRGAAHDLPMVGDDWGFDLGDVDLPVTMFHGEADATVGADLARAFGDLLPDCDLHLGDDAHYSTYVNNREAIIAAAASAE